MIVMDALGVVERNIEAWNSSDVEARLDTLRFPQYRINTRGVINVESREQARLNLDHMQGFVKEHEKWDHSVVDSVKLVHESRDKLHLSCEFSRYRADGVRYASLKSLWVMIRVDGEWKRSMVSNLPLEYYLPKNEIEILVDLRKKFMIGP